MKKTTNKPKTAKEEYPELDNLANVIARNVAIVINETIGDNISLVKTNCPYPNQCLLEMAIKRLEGCI
jgi:hypothetical protein